MVIKIFKQVNKIFKVNSQIFKISHGEISQISILYRSHFSDFAKIDPNMMWKISIVFKILKSIYTKISKIGSHHQNFEENS